MRVPHPALVSSLLWVVEAWRWKGAWEAWYQVDRLGCLSGFTEVMAQSQFLLFQLLEMRWPADQATAGLLRDQLTFTKVSDDQHKPQ